MTKPSFLAAALLASAASPTWAKADVDPMFDLDASSPMADADLARQRGGFEIAGLTISLAADLKTYLNGDLALRTVMTWSAAGRSKEVWSSPALTAATARQLQAGAFGSVPIAVRINDQSVFLANNDETVIAQRVDGGLQNILLNAASNTAITQQADITIDVGNYAAFAASQAGGLIGGGLNDAISAAATAATHP